LFDVFLTIFQVVFSYFDYKIGFDFFDTLHLQQTT
jgi:hypothetical protein